MKIGRNEKCPCGSGKKHKKCCLGKKPIVAKDIWREHKKFIYDEALRREHLGEVRPIIHIDYKGYKVVVCGSKLHFSKGWKTFTDFLFDYIKTTLGEEWGNGEIKKPAGERHQLIKWYQEACHAQQKQEREPDGLFSMTPTGPMAAYINLAYDLFILADNLRLQKEVVKRLKDPVQFQGARYELFVAATCIRAGFDINYEDETDGSKKHPEFTAKHKRSGQIIAVEAKSRHREGVLGRPGIAENAEEVRADIGRLVSRAIGKKPTNPYVIFVDLNLPPSDQDGIPAPLQKELVETVERIAKLNGSPPDPFNLILFTNHPHHYVDVLSPDPKKYVLSVLPLKPAYPASDPLCIQAIHKAALQYGNVPSKFPPTR